MNPLKINPKSNLDICELSICNGLNQILEKTKGDNNKDWTITVFEILSKLKYKDNKIACSKLNGELKDCGEWLFDYVEYEEKEIILNNLNYEVLYDIHLIVECEWNFFTKKDYFTDLKYDFEKLLVGKSNYRLFIFENISEIFILKTIEDLKTIANNFKKFEVGERILFAAWIQGNCFYFDNYVKQKTFANTVQN